MFAVVDVDAGWQNSSVQRCRRLENIVRFLPVAAASRFVILLFVIVAALMKRVPMTDRDTILQTRPTSVTAGDERWRRVSASITMAIRVATRQTTFTPSFTRSLNSIIAAGLRP